MGGADVGVEDRNARMTPSTTLSKQGTLCITSLNTRSKSKSKTSDCENFKYRNRYSSTAKM